MGRQQTAERPLAADRVALVVDHLDLLPKVLHAERIVTRRDQGVIDRDDLLAAGAEALCRAAAAWDPAVGDFVALAYTAAKQQMRREAALARQRVRHTPRTGHATQATTALDDLDDDARDRLGIPPPSPEQVVLVLADRRRVRAALTAMGTVPELAEAQGVVCERWYLELPLDLIARRRGLTVRQVHNRLAAGYRWLAVVLAADDPHASWVLAAAGRAAAGRPTRADRRWLSGDQAGTELAVAS